MNAEEGGDALRALHAYCYMHRLFLQFVKEGSSLVASARQTVKEFILEEAKRHMEVWSSTRHTHTHTHALVFVLSLSPHTHTRCCTHLQHTPAIGHIVILATFTEVLWVELAPSYLSEGFDRQVRRIVGEHCDLNTSKPKAKIDATRISKSFQSINLSGLRFLMTQLVFNRSAAI